MNVFSFFGFLSCFLFEISFSYLSFFLILSYVCCSTSLFLVSKNPSSKTPIFGQKGGCNITFFFFYEPVFCKMWKVIVFWGGFFFWQIFGCFSKNTIKIGILAHFSKQKITKKAIFKCYYLVQVKCYYLVQVGCVLKSVNLDQIITFKIFARNCFFSKKRAETPIFIVFFWQLVFYKKTNLDQIITFKTPKLGPDNNTTAYISFLGGFAVSVSCPFFDRKGKEKNKKWKQKNTKQKQNHKMQRRKPLNLVTEKESRQHRHKTIQLHCLDCKWQHTKEKKTWRKS